MDILGRVRFKDHCSRLDPGRKQLLDRCMELAGLHSGGHSHDAVDPFNAKYVGIENIQTVPTSEKLDHHAFDEDFN